MQRNLKLVIEGWRSLSHSYAIIHQWQLLAVAKRPEIDLRIKDLPFFNPSWRRQPGLFPEPCASVIQAIEQVRSDFRPDATWRVAFPYDLRPAPVGRTIVFRPIS